jgi:hypothetical protein
LATRDFRRFDAPSPNSVGRGIPPLAVSLKR